MNGPFNGIPLIIEQEDHRLLSITQHRTQFLRRELSRTIADQQHHPPIRLRRLCTECRRQGVTDRAPQRLDDKPAALRQTKSRSTKAGGTLFGDQNIARAQKVLYLLPKAVLIQAAAVRIGQRRAFNGRYWPLFCQR
ncbi:hypothetical protein D3C75_955600 [compost metagenome]